MHDLHSPSSARDGWDPLEENLATAGARRVQVDQGPGQERVRKARGEWVQIHLLAVGRPTMVLYEAMRTMEGLLLSSIKQKDNGVQEGLLGGGNQAHSLQHDHNHELSIASAWNKIKTYS